MQLSTTSLVASLRSRWIKATASELIVYTAVLIALLATWGFVAVADELLEGETQRFDDWVLHSLRVPGQPHEAIGPAWVHDFFANVTALGSGSIAALIGVIVAGALWIQGRRYSIALICISLAGAGLITAFLKDVFGRQRPPVEFRSVEAMALSFPSGHSFISAVLYLTIGAMLAQVAPGRAMKIYIMVVAVLLTFFVGLSRIFLGVHYATDVIGGWCAGILWAAICLLAGYWLRSRRRTKTIAAQGAESGPSTS
jgi:undecaprenyl-diphosphatase